MMSSPVECNCQLLRKAARRISNYYDSELAPSGLRGTQFSILALVNREGEVSVNSLAERLELDRTTAGKNLRPLQAAMLIRIAPSKNDRRARAITLTKRGRSASVFCRRSLRRRYPNTQVRCVWTNSRRSEGSMSRSVGAV